MVALWRHECERVFEDKLINYGDKKIFHDIMDRVTKEKFRDTLNMDDEQLMTSLLCKNITLLITSFIYLPFSLYSR